MDRFIGLDAHASSCTLGVVMPGGLRGALAACSAVMVTGVQESRGPKDDRRDAFGLADALRLGAIERAVYKDRGHFGALGYRARGYRWIRDDAVRVKNRLKSVYRSRGVAVPGTTVYTAAGRGAYLNRLPRPARPLAELL